MMARPVKLKFELAGEAKSLCGGGGFHGRLAEWFRRIIYHEKTIPAFRQCRESGFAHSEDELLFYLSKKRPRGIKSVGSPKRTPGLHFKKHCLTLANFG